MSDSEPRESKKVLRRKKHKNSRLGCPQCKQRRIKCDEALPSCKKCIGRSIRCDYLDFSQQELDIIRQAHMDDDELYQHTMGPMNRLIEQNCFIQYQQNQQPFPSNQSLQTPPIQASQYSQQSMYYPQPQFLPQQQHFLSTQQIDGYYQQQSQHQQYSQSSKQPFQYSEGLQQHIDEQTQKFQSYEKNSDPTLQPSGLNDFNQYNRYEMLSRACSRTDQDRTSQSSTVSQRSHPTQCLSPIPASITTIQQQHQQSQQMTSGESTTPFAESSISSYSSKNSLYKADGSRNMDIYFKDFLSPESSVQSPLNPNELLLIRHEYNEPQFDLVKRPEFFHETIPNVFARVFLLKEVHQRLKRSMISSTIYSGMILQGLGTLTLVVPELVPLFLKYRGFCMKIVRKELSRMSDSNAEHLLVLTSLLNSSSIFIKNMTVKDFFSLASGPSVLLRTAFEDPSKFKKSFSKLKNHADGLLFTARSVWNPRYNHHTLFEFLEVVKEFGKTYIDDEDQYDDDNDSIKVQYGDLVEYIEFALRFLENEKSDKHVLRYPVDKLFKLVQRWYQFVPSQIYTFSSKTDPVEKVFYVFWFALADILESIFVGGSYIFTFLFNGFHLLYPFNKTHLYENLENEDLIKYANYTCRILAFLSRRKAYIVRNKVLNDPIPAFFDSVDRFKPRSLDIHEHCITDFKTTKIKPFHYPSESATSGNLSNRVNYYKARDDGDDSSETLDLLSDLNTNLGIDSFSDMLQGVDMLDANPETSLLNDDYDPRFIDPIFQTNVVFQSADLNFLTQYHEDRKLIIQLDTGV